MSDITDEILTFNDEQLKILNEPNVQIIYTPSLSKIIK